MPECNGCGASYEDNFNFCPFCGKAKPVPSTITVKVESDTESVWEMCEIFTDVVEKGRTGLFSGTNDTLKWWARAVGPTGVYNARESKVFKADGLGHVPNVDRFRGHNLGKEFEDRSKFAEEEFYCLVARLIEDGWEMIPSEGLYYFKRDCRFRRRVKKQAL